MIKTELNSIEYKLTHDEGPHIIVVANQKSKMTVHNHKGKVELVFLDSNPKMLRILGELLVEASKLHKGD
jgi:hypothetical protein